MTRTKGNTTMSAMAAALDALQRRSEIEARIAELKREIEAAAGERATAYGEQRAAEDALDDVLGRLRRVESRDANDASIAELREEASHRRTKHGELRSKFDSANERIDELNAELQRLQTEDLPAVRAGVTLEAVLEQQKLVAAADQEARDIEREIEKQCARADAAHACIAEAPDRDAERQDLLAAIAVGKATPAELEALDRKIAQERKAAEEAGRQAGPSEADARATAAGLERLLSAAKSNAGAARDQLRRFLVHYLHSEAERAAAEYAKLATGVKECLTRVRGAQDLISQLGEPAMFFHLDWSRFWMPALRTPQFQEMGSCLCSAEHRVPYDRAADEQAKRLRDLGVEI